MSKVYLSRTVKNQTIYAIAYNTGRFSDGSYEVELSDTVFLCVVKAMEWIDANKGKLLNPRVVKLPVPIPYAPDELAQVFG